MSDTYEGYHNLKILFTESLEDLLAFDDWSDSLLIEAEAKSGFAKGYRHILFPNGLSEIIDFLEEQYDQKMLELLSGRARPQKIRDRIELALKIRIKEYVPKLVHFKNSVYFAKGPNTIVALKIALRSCNLIWRYAGDQSVDYNYYTKRSLLLTVYITSIIYYIQDNSSGNIDTDGYITESLADIINITSKFKNIFKLPKLVDIPIIRLFS